MIPPLKNRRTIASLILWTGIVAGPSFASDKATIAAACDSLGIVRISYSVPSSRPLLTATLYRTYLALDSPGDIDIYAYPISTVTLPAGSSGGVVADSFLANGMTYRYYLAAQKSDGGVDWSNVAVVTTPARALQPKQIRDCCLLIDKNSYTLGLYSGKTLLKTYPVCLGGDPVSRKLHQDNLTTPEGIYAIDYIQPHSKFYKALGVSYPNAADRARYREARKKEHFSAGIGGSIQIHGGGIGNNWTWGCIALRNDDIDELLAIPGVKPGAKVIIVGKEFSRKSW
jgi:L,D-transpeptidase catalytic domain